MQASRGPRNQRLWVGAIPLGVSLCAFAASCSPGDSLWAGNRGPATDDETRSVAGELTSLTSRRLTIETHRDEVGLGIKDGVRVTIDGKKAELRDLQPRQFVEVETEEQGRDLLASVIAARSRMWDRQAVRTQAPGDER